MHEADSSDEEGAHANPAGSRTPPRENEDSSDSSSDSSASVDVDAGTSSGPTNLGGDRWLVVELLEFRISAGVKKGDVFRAGTHMYKVRWAGCTEDDDSWEPKTKIAAPLIAAFNASRSGESAEHGEKRGRAAGSALSPSAKSPASKK